MKDKLFITLYSYRAKPGQREAVLSLYREWQQLLTNFHAVSTELLSDSQEGCDMIMLARFQDEDTAWRAAESAEHRAWYAQLAQLMEQGPIVNWYERQ